MKVLAVDVGGTHVSCGAVDGNELLQVTTVETDRRGNLSDLLPVVTTTLRQMTDQIGNGFTGIGFGFCGLVDSAAGRIVSTNHKYSDATQLDLTSWARNEFGLPLILENDSRLALLGECYAGAAKSSEDVVMMTLGTGIGTAVIMGGCLMRGKHFQAGVLGGHLTSLPGGALARAVPRVASRRRRPLTLCRTSVELGRGSIKALLHTSRNLIFERSFAGPMRATWLLFKSDRGALNSGRHAPYRWSTPTIPSY